MQSPEGEFENTQPCCRKSDGLCHHANPCLGLIYGNRANSPQIRTVIHSWAHLITRRLSSSSVTLPRGVIYSRSLSFPHKVYGMSYGMLLDAGGQHKINH